jgi:prolyl oligopeptidase
MSRLEDPDAEEVKEFVQKQVKLTESVLEKCETREKLCEKITKLFDHPRYGAPFKRGDKYFYFHNTGLQAQSVLYVQVRELELDLGEVYVCALLFGKEYSHMFLIQDSLDGEAEVLLDPNVLSEDGTVSLSSLSVSEGAKYLAYGLSTSGSDWSTIKVMRVEDKQVEADTLSWVGI